MPETTCEPAAPLPPDICPICAADPQCSAVYVPALGRVWVTHCSHSNVGATLDLGDGSAKPRWFLVPNVSRDEWETLLALSASKAQRIAQEGADAVRKASETH